MTLARTHRKVLAAAFASVTILLILHIQFGTSDIFSTLSTIYHPYTGTTTQTLPCRELPIANDTLVVMKTGSTELQDKLPIHFNTTLRCYPNYIIYSDVSEVFQGQQILDSLEDVNPEIKANHEDFELYRRLQQQSGRAGLEQHELSGPGSRPPGASGKTENPGWKLDKWKFLPMMRKTLQNHPDRSWYIFVETDTFIFWETLMEYLAVLDSTKPYYIGGQTWIGDVEFAHGGSGFLVSRPALQLVVKQYEDNQQHWETFTDNHWAGDCVLGKAFKDAGISLTPAWPIWQGDDIGNMNYGHSQRLWCQPTVSYHHLDAPAIEDLWNYGQNWASRISTTGQTFLRHRDVFAEYIMPRTTTTRSDWDNHADNDRGPVESPEACQKVCEDDSSCLQWVLDSEANRRCLTTSRPNMGEPAQGKTSGWVTERMQAFYDAEDPCTDDGWIL